MLNLVVTTLEELINLQKQLIVFAERKKLVLIERKVDDLNRLVKEESILVKQLSQLENERAQRVESLLQEYPTLSFSQFVEQIPDNLTRTNVQLQVKTLQLLIGELQEKNNVNKTLLEDSMSFVQYMIDQVTKSKQQHFNYQPPLAQQKSQTSNRGFFDTKA
ncbi:flagellar protein FlgN [Paenisporosarcina sp. TG-14]|uniref:flagellar protein FlgN n=1 Tax=Paenisporosarcina sp. TG-14 TaxID=1231057 RepID=UPI0002D5EDDC|nr:flagellar protein FlgN [Paenisporosarcina sp. TG-14]